MKFDYLVGVIKNQKKRKQEQKIQQALYNFNHSLRGEINRERKEKIIFRMYCKMPYYP